MSDATFSSTVKFFDEKKGWGYIFRTPETDTHVRNNHPGAKEDDIFFHFSEINMKGYKTLAKGANVSFSVIVDDRAPGRVKAVQVTPQA